MTGRLTTHALDLSTGLPAAGLTLRLFALEGPIRRLLVSTQTNADGRTDQPLLSGEAMRVGVFEIEFDAGDQFRANGLRLASPFFLDVVPIRFGLSDPSVHVHVPLLLSPFGYSTYRGS